MKKEKHYKKVEVTWADANLIISDLTSDFVSANLVIVKTIGFLLYQDINKTVLTFSYYQDVCREILVIPTKSIKKIKVLK